MRTVSTVGCYDGVVLINDDKRILMRIKNGLQVKAWFLFA